MKTKLLLLSFLLLTSFDLVHAQAINKSDSLALVDFYNSTNGSSWTNHKNWLSKKPVSTWFGVGVTGDRVTTLSFPSNRITGSLPASFTSLSALTSFYSYSNPIEGSLPADFGQLTSLTSFNITYSQLTGSIPTSIGNLSNLTSLTLTNGKLTGHIPVTIGKLRKLTELNLGLNQLTGSIPGTIAGIDSLVTLFLNGNHLTGNIPSLIGKLAYLQTLSLSANDFSGSIPAAIGNLSSLTFLDLGYDHLSGNIPGSIGNAKNLEVIALNHNQLSGSIPLSLGKIKPLTLLDLSENSLTGGIPPNIVLLPNLFSFELYSNHLTDEGNLSNLGGRTFPSLELAIGGNDFTFNTLEYVASHFPQSYYTEQARLRIHQHGNILAVRAGGTLSNNTYTWYKTGETTGTTIVGDSTFQPVAPGSYYAAVSNSVATATVLTTDTANYTPPVNESQTGKISVYPNPVKSILTINGLNSKSRSSITVSDLTGAVRMSMVSENQASVQYDVSRLTPGNYQLKIINGIRAVSIMFLKQ